MHRSLLRSTHLIVMLAVVGGFLAQPAIAASWLFKPVGTDTSSDYSAPDVDDSKWTPVRLPHREWDKLQPLNYVYGWYRCHFTVPAECKGNELLLKLGIVDDTDWTFLNGVPVGTTAAYNAERVYVIPPTAVRAGEDNVLAIKVYDLIGTGGLLSEPRIGLRLTNSKQWLFHSGDAPEPGSWAPATFDDSQWDKIAMPDEEWDKRQPANKVYGWFRLHFVVPTQWRLTGQVLDLGIVCDVDSTFINGRLVGKTGEFPPKYASAAGDPRKYAVPDDLLKAGSDNVLAVRVFNGEAKGGIQGEPMLALPLGEADEGVARLAKAQRLRHAGELDEAERLIREIIAAEKAPAVAAKALDELVVILGAKGADDEALATFERMLRDYPYESCTGDSAGVVCAVQSKRKMLCNDVAYLGEDRLTQGRWWLKYGNDGFVLCNAGGDCDVYGLPGVYRFSDPNLGNANRAPNAPLPYHALRFTDEDTATHNWVAAVRTEDPRALYNPITRANTAAWWDDKGETHPFDDQGPDLKDDLSIPQGEWRLALYLVDLDWWNTWHPRQQATVLTDEEGHILAAADTGKFGQGVWQRFYIRGPKKITVRIAKNRSNCAILSAIMLDRIPPPLPAEISGLLGGHGDGGDTLEDYRRTSSMFVASPPEYVRRLQELTQAASTVPADEVMLGLRAWSRWQAMVVACPGSPQGPAELDAYAKVLLKLEPGLVQGVLEQQVEILMGLRQYGAAQSLDALRARLLSERPPSYETIQSLQKLMERWLTVDDFFAVQVFRTQLATMTALPPDMGLPLMAALIQPFAERGRELMPNIIGDYRPHIVGHARLELLARPCGTPSAGQTALAAIGALPRDVALKHFTQFLARWGDHERRVALQDSRLTVDDQLRILDTLVAETLLIQDVKTPAYSSKVWILARAGRVDEALKAAEEFWGSDPDPGGWCAVAGLTLAEALVRQARYKEAETAYQRVIEVCSEAEPKSVDIARRALSELARMSGKP